MPDPEPEPDPDSASSLHHSASRAGVSGMALYVPRPRVSLQQWCQWYGTPWDKVRAVVGEGFRVCSPGENAYTMAAAAALRLIES